MSCGSSGGPSAADRLAHGGGAQCLQRSGAKVCAKPLGSRSHLVRNRALARHSCDRVHGAVGKAAHGAVVAVVTDDFDMRVDRPVP
jgi:hypothetical protein